MSKIFGFLSLLLAVVLGAGLAMGVASGLSPADVATLCRGEPLVWPWLCAQPDVCPASSPSDNAPPQSVSNRASSAASALSGNSRRNSTTPADGSQADSVEPRPLSITTADAAKPTPSASPANAREERTGPEAAERPSSRSRQGAKAHHTASRDERTKTGETCASPPDDHQAKLLSIIHELVRQPHVQPVSARMAEQAAGSEPKNPVETANPTVVQVAAPIGGSPLPAAAAPRLAQAPEKKPGPVVEASGDADKTVNIFVTDEDIRNVLTLLGVAGNMSILPSPNVSGTVSFSMAKVSAEEALEAILKSKGLAARREGRFIYVGTQEEFAAQEKKKDRITTRIYRPNYVTANEIKSLLTPLMSVGIGKISVTTQAKGGIESNDNQAGGNDLAIREAVLAQDYESVLSQMDRVVLEIDRRPLQVAIEAMILSVKLDDQHQTGIDFQFLRNQGTVRLGLGSPGPDLGSVGFTDGGLKLAFLDGNIGAFVKALETIGDTNVISTPRLLTLNKQRAEILIGAELGYVSTTVTETTSTQNIEFLEVGTALRIRPFISSDGMIRMEIHPELSTGQVRVESGLTLPDKEVTKVTTNIMVRDGNTVIIGGLMREDLNKNARRIPFLGTLPSLGSLFGSKDEKTERREILVLVTPQIVQDDDQHAEGDAAACEFLRRQNVFGDSMSPAGRTHLARKYFRLAQEAWAAGNQERARRYIDLSLHMNPSDRAAIDLRTDITAGNPHGEHTLSPNSPHSHGMGAGPPVILHDEVIDGSGQGSPPPHLPQPRLLPPGAAELPPLNPLPNSTPPLDGTPQAAPSRTHREPELRGAAAPGSAAPQAARPQGAANNAVTTPKTQAIRRAGLMLRPGRKT